MTPKLQICMWAVMFRAKGGRNWHFSMVVPGMFNLRRKAKAALDAGRPNWRNDAYQYRIVRFDAEVPR